MQEHPWDAYCNICDEFPDVETTKESAIEAAQEHYERTEHRPIVGFRIDGDE